MGSLWVGRLKGKTMGISKPALALMTMLAAISAGPLSACIHVPRTYKGTVTEKTKEALLFHDGVNSHLIIKTNLQAASGSLPDTMAWVIPLPSLPSHYEEVDPAIFQEMFTVVEKANAKREREQSKGIETASSGTAPSGIRIHPTQIVGSYQIQPIEIIDVKSAGGELNHWLLANGFGSVPTKNQGYYLKRGAVFLALKIHGLKGKLTDIKPLHIVYKAHTLSLPLKFSTHSGVFGVEMYAFTPGPLDTTLLLAEQLYADPSVKINSEAEAPLLWKVTGRKQGYLTRYEGRALNSTYEPNTLVKNFPSDPAIDLGKDNSPRQTAQVAGKSDYGDIARLSASAFILLAGFGIWRRAQLRRSNQTSI